MKKNEYETSQFLCYDVMYLYEDGCLRNCSSYQNLNWWGFFCANMLNLGFIRTIYALTSKSTKTINFTNKLDTKIFAIYLEQVSDQYV